MNAYPYIAIDRNRNVFRINGQKLVRVDNASLSSAERRVAALRPMDYYRHSLVAMAAVQDGTIVSRWKMNANTFHLASPFDYSDAVDRYIRGELVYPLKISVNSTDKCNFACQVCQNKHERLSGIPLDLDINAYFQMLTAILGKGFSVTHDLSCGGSGEAIVHKDFIKLLSLSHKMGITTFFTTNGSRKDQPFIDAVAQNTTVAVFSFHGIFPEGFAALEKPPKAITFERIVDTLRRIIEKRNALGRRDDLTMGILALVHPMNRGYYKGFIERMLDMGIDYINLNPILPNPYDYGLEITPEITDQMRDELYDLKNHFASLPQQVRIPDEPFFGEKMKFFDPRPNRYYPDECMVSLLQPYVGPMYGRPGRTKLTACRLYPNATNDPAYYYTDQLGKQPFEEVWTKENIARIMREAAKCSECSNERQVLALDWMLHVRRTIPGAEYFIIFPINPEAHNVIKYSETTGKEEKTIPVKGDE